MTPKPFLWIFILLQIFQVGYHRPHEILKLETIKSAKIGFKDHKNFPCQRAKKAKPDEQPHMPLIKLANKNFIAKRLMNNLWLLSAFIIGI